ncbi:unnamed protein product [Vitrella brassicaformis CCMP3155]|uniref:Protein kinase domain-containing protein n=3 Tax=Vitrella brassicaformis TaxID=1169539 RepID=A0A0G4EHJ5_VITBC|nr:unnamed protein product [Vitrella brassicaformis CCMP3155]|eukprot:CEL95453.1 unnamed protein product [Vitrella brassicaformis CCMP3155]
MPGFRCPVKLHTLDAAEPVNESDFKVRGTGQYRHPCFLPPECFVGNGEEDRSHDGRARDVWGLGVTAAVLLYGRIPWMELSRSDYELQCYRGDLRVALPPEPAISTDMRNLLEGMLHPDTSQRLTLPDVFAHPAVAHLRPLMQSVVGSSAYGGDDAAMMSVEEENSPAATARRSIASIWQAMHGESFTESPSAGSLLDEWLAQANNWGLPLDEQGRPDQQEGEREGEDGQGERSICGSVGVGVGGVVDDKYRVVCELGRTKRSKTLLVQDTEGGGQMAARYVACEGLWREAAALASGETETKLMQMLRSLTLHALVHHPHVTDVKQIIADVPSRSLTAITELSPGGQAMKYKRQLASYTIRQLHTGTGQGEGRDIEDDNNLQAPRPPAADPPLHPPPAPPAAGGGVVRTAVDTTPPAVSVRPEGSRLSAASASMVSSMLSPARFSQPRRHRIFVYTEDIVKDIVVQVGMALSHLHSVGIAHKQVLPENIVLTHHIQHNRASWVRERAVSVSVPDAIGQAMAPVRPDAEPVFTSRFNFN